jgi:hypothetical protein
MRAVLSDHEKSLITIDDRKYTGSRVEAVLSLSAAPSIISRDRIGDISVHAAVAIVGMLIELLSGHAANSVVMDGVPRSFRLEKSSCNSL